MHLCDAQTHTCTRAHLMYSHSAAHAATTPAQVPFYATPLLRLSPCLPKARTAAASAPSTPFAPHPRLALSLPLPLPGPAPPPHRPDVVTGRAVPGLDPLSACCRLAVPRRPLAEVLGRALPVPGRAKPVSGRPLLVMGRTAWLGPPPWGKERVRGEEERPRVTKTHEHVTQCTLRSTHPCCRRRPRLYAGWYAPLTARMRLGYGGNSPRSPNGLACRALHFPCHVSPAVCPSTAVTTLQALLLLLLHPAHCATWAPATPAVPVAPAPPLAPPCTHSPCRAGERAR